MEPQITETCSVCHQPVKSEYYFCPNCGAALKQAPLPVSLSSQMKLYAFSAVLPWILFIMITKWKGFTYLKSKDAQAKQIGILACAILILSTALTFWAAYAFTEQLVQSSLSSLNTDMSF